MNAKQSHTEYVNPGKTGSGFFPGLPSGAEEKRFRDQTIMRSLPESIVWPDLSRRLFLASGWAVVMLLARQIWYLTEPVGALGAAFFIKWFISRYLFLVWNLLLAWIPFLLVLALARQTPQGRFAWPAWPLWILWFFFLPNAPYLLTDFIHLRPRPPVPMWYDAGLLFSFTAIGWALGIFSLLSAERLVQERFGYRHTWWFGPVVLAACAFGVALGRILRWNSWDIIIHPLAVGRDVVRLTVYPYYHLHYWALTIVLFGMLMVSYRLLGTRKNRLA